MNIYYDGDCPFCSRYVKYTRLRESAGPVTMVNVREHEAVRRRFADAGFDLDGGMVVETGGRVYHGSEAVNVLALLSSGAGTFNRLTAALLRSPRVAKAAYPLLRAGRNATLFALGRMPIQARDEKESASFEVFARFLGIFTVLHVIAYALRYSQFGYTFTTLPLLVTGLAMAVAPQSRRLFVVTAALLAVDGILHAPVASNHTILKNFLMIAVVVGGLWHWLKGSTFETFFQAVRPVGRCLLLTMYTFGIFHKINTDFVDPTVSCAVELWRAMPPPLAWLDTPLIHYATIYGTFIGEGVIMLCLLVPRLRSYGIAGGVIFHGLLALSGYSMYSPFSTLAVALHTLFLSPERALNVVRSASFQTFERILRRPVGIGLLVSIFSLLAVHVLVKDFVAVGLLWAMVVTWPLIVLVGHSRTILRTDGNFLWSGTTALNFISLAFFINCAGPYLGLKTAQTLNMFANIRVEGGVSNHLLVDKPGPFHYLDDLVVITDARESHDLARYVGGEYALVWYSFLDKLERTPTAEVSFTRAGKIYQNVRAADLLRDEGHLLHPQWFRAYFHFLPVRLQERQRCSYS